MCVLEECLGIEDKVKGIWNNKLMEKGKHVKIKRELCFLITDYVQIMY